MRVIVTRPAAQADAWVRSFAQHGVDAVALPLIDIAPAADTAAVDQAWSTLGKRRLVVFVSPNAAERFFDGGPSAVAWPTGVQAGSVGPGTTDALLRRGVPADAIVQPAADAPQFDSESLWQQLAPQDWCSARVLVVRGDGGREWLAEALRARGAQVDVVSAYRRVAPVLDGAACRVLDESLTQPQRFLWFFSSSQAIAHLHAARPEAGWSQASAVATHPRIAQRARDCGFGVVRESRPTLAAVVACIQSFAS